MNLHETLQGKRVCAKPQAAAHTQNYRCPCMWAHNYAFCSPPMFIHTRAAAKPLKLPVTASPRCWPVCQWPNLIGPISPGACAAAKPLKLLMAAGLRHWRACLRHWLACMQQCMAGLGRANFINAHAAVKLPKLPVAIGLRHWPACQWLGLTGPILPTFALLQSC